jgi:hypothetical protein
VRDQGLSGGNAAISILLPELANLLRETALFGTFGAPARLRACETFDAHFRGDEARLIVCEVRA